MGHQSFFETEKSPQTRMNTKKNVPDSKIRHIIWWEKVDSNHRSMTQQIYSLIANCKKTYAGVDK